MDLCGFTNVFLALCIFLFFPCSLKQLQHSRVLRIYSQDVILERNVFLSISDVVSMCYLLCVSNGYITFINNTTTTGRSAFKRGNLRNHFLWGPKQPSWLAPQPSHFPFLDFFPAYHNKAKLGTSKPYEISPGGCKTTQASDEAACGRSAVFLCDDSIALCSFVHNLYFFGR